MRLRRIAAALVLGAVALFAVTGLAASDNPSVDVSAADVDEVQPAGTVECSIAPWDAALNGNDDAPGGEHSGDYSDEVAAECYSANRRRFDLAVGIGVLATVLLGSGAVTAVRADSLAAR